MSLQSRCTFALLLSTSVCLPCQEALSDSDLSLSSTIEAQSQSSIFSLEAEKKLQNLEFNSELAGEFAAPYKSPQNFDDNLSASLSLTSLRTLRPMLGATASHSVRDKITTFGALGGFTLPLISSRLKLSWIERLSLKRTAIKLNNQATSVKSQKKPQPSIIQYGFNQTLFLSESDSRSMSFFYQKYLYSADVSELSAALSTSARLNKNKRSLKTITELLSTFADSVMGASLNWQILENTQVKTDYFYTSMSSGNIDSEMIVPRITTEISDKLSTYIQADLVLSEPNSRTFTLAFPYEWSNAASTDVGIVRTATTDETTWGVLLGFNYQVDETRPEITTESQNQ